MLKKLFGKKEPREITVSSHGLRFDVPAGKTLLEAALEGGIGFPHSCKVGTCGSCRYRLDEGKIAELNSSARALSGADYQAGFRLGCQTLPRSKLSIWLPSLSDAVAAVQSFDGRIVQVKPLTGDIVNLKLRLDRPISFLPGQYADLSVEAIEGARSYSFADASNCESTEEVSFHVRRVPGGVFTGWLFATDRLGAPVRLQGPQGAFRLRDGDTPIICIGGGSGLAPLKCILEHAHRAGCTRPATLLYGARTQADLYCLAEIEEISARWGAAFRFLPVLSCEPGDSDWQGARGLVVDHASQLPELPNSQAYLCGPPPMVDAAEALLSRLGVPAANIFADRFFDRSQV